MASASFVQDSFVGGEWSATAQGRLSDPRYKTALSVCVNGYPTEPAAWTRRSGSMHIGATRAGLAGRVVSFDFKESTPYYIVLTDGSMRFRAGSAQVTTNDDQTVSAISAASPAVVQTSAAHGWTGTIPVMLKNTANGYLENRRFSATVTDTTHLSLVDEITGANLDGSIIGTVSASAAISRIHDLSVPYTGTWSDVRVVQAETNAVLLQATVPPQVLSVATQPTASSFAQFALAPAQFVDGPYLDPAIGATLTPASVTGIVGFSMASPTWSSSAAYNTDDYVVYSGTTYVSIIDKNTANEPDTATFAWKSVAQDKVIGPEGLQNSDIGRHIRLMSEPANWASGTTYSAGTNVKYNYQYWTSLVGTNTGNTPGVDATKWEIATNATLWTWGKIVSLTGATATLVGPGLGPIIGTSPWANYAAAFDGLTSQALYEGAHTSGAGPWYLGKNFTGESGQSVSYAVVYGPNNAAFATKPGGGTAIAQVTLNLRGKSTLPSSSSDGTLLGTVIPSNLVGETVQIFSNDTVTAWNYLWVEFIVSSAAGDFGVAEIQFYTTASFSGTGISVQIIGPNLLYTTAINTWRLGAYTSAGDYPACGTYHEGRLWLAGSIDNRFDASALCDINGNPSQSLFYFTPTLVDGTVSDACAINYTLDGPDVNAIFHMTPDHQGIICGTQAGEWLVQATANNNILTPTSIQAHRVTKIGCANVEPRRSEHTLLLVQKHLRKVVEYFADVFSGKFTAPNLNVDAKHLTYGGIQEIAYQQELTPILWGRRGDGTLIGMTYKRDTLMTSQGPTLNGWHHHPLGSGRTVESICVGANNDGTLDALAMVTSDGSVRHVELMQKQFEEGDALTDAWFLDDAISATSYSTAYVMGGAPGIVAIGFWPHNGKTVTVFAGGLDLGEWSVTNGSISIPFNKNPLFTSTFVAGFSGAMKIIAGFGYTSQGQLLPPDAMEAGARNGPGFGKLRIVHKYAAQLVNTQKIKFGTSLSKLRMPVLPSSGRTQTIADNVLYTGTIKEGVDDTGQDFSGQLCWQVDRPFPATVAKIAGFARTEDE